MLCGGSGDKDHDKDRDNLSSRLSGLPVRRGVVSDGCLMRELGLGLESEYQETRQWVDSKNSMITWPTR